MQIEKLIRNKAKCLKCGEVAESKSGHDFRRCKCGAIAVDGGLEYRRGVMESHDIYEDQSEYYTLHYPTWDDYKAGKQPIKVEFSKHVTLEHRRKLLRDWLTQGEFVVTFKKIDGELRNMPCTIQEGKVPVVESKTGRVKKPNDEVMSVYATDKNEWRSFRVENVLSIEMKEQV